MIDNVKLNKNVLCVTYGGGHAAMMAPVIKKLKSDSSLNVFVMGLTTAKKHLEKEGIDSFGYNEYAFLVDPIFESYGKQALLSVERSSQVSEAETIAYIGVNLLELVEKNGEECALNQYKFTGRQSFLPKNFYIKLLNHLNIDLVIATNSPRSEQASILAARELNLNAICLVDLFALQEFKWIKCNSYADKICVLNQKVRDFLISKGRNADDIVVTGNPVFDRINDEKNLLSKNKFQWNENNEINILYASQIEPEKHPFCDLNGNPELPRQIEGWLRRFVENNDNYNLIIRSHPNENVQFFSQEKVFEGSGHLHQIIHSVDIVVTMTSTVGLEAYIAGKKVITVDLSIFTKDAPYSAMGISTGVSDERELHSTILNFKNELYKASVNRDSMKKPALNNIISEIYSTLELAQGKDVEI